MRIRPAWIRPATLLDLPALMNLLRRVVSMMRQSNNFQWDEHYPNHDVLREDIEKGQLWVAEVDGLLAGVAALTEEQEPEYAQVGFDLNERVIVTHRLAVDPAFQGRGLATGLLANQGAGTTIQRR